MARRLHHYMTFRDFPCPPKTATTVLEAAPTRRPNSSIAGRVTRPFVFGDLWGEGDKLFLLLLQPLLQLEDGVAVGWVVDQVVAFFGVYANVEQVPPASR